jgi:regulator of replication initiation timing
MAGEHNNDDVTTVQDKINDCLNNAPSDLPEWGKTVIGLLSIVSDQLSQAGLRELNEKVAVQSTVCDRLVDENKRLKTEVETLKERVKSVEISVDANEQHDRNINLILYGVPEEENEKTTNLFVDNINKHFPAQAKLKYNDIARSHRLGKRDPGRRKPRGIIARFSLETKKISTYKNKRNLSKKGIHLTENLTRFRTGLYSMACDLLNYKNVWTLEGRIFAMIQGRKTHIQDYYDIPGYVAEDAEDVDYGSG